MVVRPSAVNVEMTNVRKILRTFRPMAFIGKNPCNTVIAGKAWVAATFSSYSSARQKLGNNWTCQPDRGPSVSKLPALHDDFRHSCRKRTSSETVTRLTVANAVNKAVVNALSAHDVVQRDFRLA